ncbi:hypothetical protein SDRG_00812 [Saprolegnia diclina VS20]|uniref:F-box domain-containing protein n=1 Tax=Saprolegnia diclina (strain VS20) TaxID=1156394 RepID=T0S9N2_SAPDV|nr:hypothetical protein SDRG_00812 [Saprolegnia diclina VS20]EQC41963.1 hypothetical protein SDRG_00812 [Saprolegnia diclina VS20]|eukprot:XP_008604532.1 hypothetical protein SDRG_00812 [Saprolegnia diclina VS20]
MSRSVLDVADVLVAIVQCTPSHKDVASLLRALPPAALTPPLAALLELLSLDKRRMTAPFWPQPRIRVVNEANIDRFATAMPIFTSVCIDAVSISKRWPTYEDAACDDDDLPFLSFVVHWAAKMTKLTSCTSYNKLGLHRMAFVNMLRKCTNLEAVQLPYAVDMLEAVTTPAHCVQDLELQHFGNDHEYPLDAVSMIERWLASGHARRLSLVGFRTGDAGLGKALVLAASTLSHLCLRQSPTVVQTVILNGVAWTHLTELDLVVGNTSAGTVLREIAPLLNVSQLQKLTLRGAQGDNGAFFVSLLPSLAELTDLHLVHVDLTQARPMVNGPLMLRSACFHFIQWTDMSFAAVLDWTLRSPTLETITWSGSDSFLSENPDTVQDATRRCLAAGVRRIVFDEDSVVSSEMLAGAVRGIHLPTLCTIVCSTKMETAESVRSLLAALATCTNVTLNVRVYPSHALSHEAFCEEAQEAGATVDFSAFGRYCLLHSPSNTCV